MRKPRLLACLAALLALALPYASREARAQTSLFTVPTGESLPESETYLEFDFDAHPTSYKKGGFQSYGVFLVRGVGHGVEVGVNSYFLKDGDGESEPVEFQSAMNLSLRVTGWTNPTSAPARLPESRSCPTSP